MNMRTNKQGVATISAGIKIQGMEQLNYLISKIKAVESVLDIERG